MDVQKSNFTESVETFQNSLSHCEFIALDLEFTGVRGRPETYIDMCEDRYSSLRRIASTFKIIQVGLSCFIRTDSSWEAHPYNFYVFPSEVPGFNQRLVLEIGAINFLKEHKMDFNTWFYNGIPYLNEAQTKELESKLTEINENEQEDMVLTKTYEQVKMNEICFRIEKWLESGEGQLEIPGLNAYLRKYLYGVVKKKYKNIFMESLKHENSRDVILVLKKANEQEYSELEAKRQLGKAEQFNEKVGFRKVFSMLTESKKPLIVHNGMLDIMFTLSSFQEDLPEKYLDFKSLVSRLFPTIYDTRFMLEHIPGFFEDFDKVPGAKGLKELYNFLKPNNPEVSLGAKFEKYYDERYAHEAGFDAFMTGICFLRLANTNIDLTLYKNHLPLFRCYFSIRLDSEDPLYSDNWHYLKGPDLKTHFAGTEGYVYRYVKDDECFVKPLSPDKQNEMELVAGAKKLICLSVESFFKKKTSDKDS